MSDWSFYSTTPATPGDPVTECGCLPAGGTVDQILIKDSGTDFDASWQDAPAAPAASEVRYYTIGGTNDLADWTSGAENARRTFSTGTYLDSSTLRCSLIQSAPPPTVWTDTDAAILGWASPAFPVSFGDTIKASMTVMWTRTANSLLAASFGSPSVPVDVLAYNANEYLGWAIDGYSYTAGADYGGPLNADVVYDYTIGWLYKGAAFTVTWETTIHDQATVDFQVEGYSSRVWGNAAGHVDLIAARIEVIHNEL